MRTTTLAVNILAAAALTFGAVSPVLAVPAQKLSGADNGLHLGFLNVNSDWLNATATQSSRRQKTKNEWRNLAIAAGALGVLGLLKKDNTLTFAGAAGALYSAYRYEQDRKSQSKIDRARAAYFSKPYFVRNGKRYDRKTVVKNGKKYYQFVLHK